MRVNIFLFAKIADYNEYSSSTKRIDERGSVRRQAQNTFLNYLKISPHDLEEKLSALHDIKLFII